MSTTLIIIILVAVALLLYAVEGLLVPGFGIAGAGATLCVIVADVLVYYTFGPTAAIAAVLLSTAAVLFAFWRFSRSKTLDRMSLHSTISSTAATEAQLSVRPGDTGRALTRLALIGNAEIGGKVVEVKSTGAFIDEGTPVEVTAVREALILVRESGPTA